MAKSKKPEECTYFAIKDFDTFQHYKKRNPPWVKLHYWLLDDDDFLGLDLVSQRHLMVLFMVAGRKDNRIPNTPSYLQKVMRLDAPPDLSSLFRSGWLLALSYQKSSNSLASCKQNATSETETDSSETETDNTDSKKIKKKVLAERPEEVSEEVWEAFKYHREKKRAAVTMIALDGIREEAIKAGYTLEAALKECCERGWQGFKADWVKTNGREFI